MGSTQDSYDLGAGPSASERELLVAAAGGDRDARAEVVERYRPLVARIARSLHGRGGSEEIDDLIQVGMIGLLEALSRFDPDQGAFAPFASATISGTIKRHFRDRSWKLRIPRGLHDAATLVRSRTVELEGTLGRQPTDEELATATELEVEQVIEARQMLAGAHPVSIEAPAGEGGSELGELIGSEDPAYARAEQRQTVAMLTAGLPAEDRELLTRRYGLEQTQVEIADQLGGSQMRISRKLRKLLGQMAGRSGASPRVGAE